MDENKVCFITCANNDEQYGEARLYMEAQQLPDGMTAEYRVVTGAESMCAGYNAAMKSSDAKYKIYLHQDLCLVALDMVKKCVELFLGDDKLGLLGTVGCVKLPPSCIWWDAEEICGYSTYTLCPEELTQAGEDVAEKVKLVQALDGILLMTQYDIPWREDLFRGWHFYDVSQCMEFARAGLKVAVPQQGERWCIHDTKKNWGDYEVHRAIFLKEYGAELGLEV